MGNLREGVGAVLGEHGDENVEDISKLRLVRRGNINEDVLRVDGDFGAVRVDLGQRSQM